LKYKKYLNEMVELKNDILRDLPNGKTREYINVFKPEIILIIESTIKLRRTTGDKLNIRYLIFRYNEQMNSLEGMITSKTESNWSTPFMIKQFEDKINLYENILDALHLWISHYRMRRQNVRIVKVIYQKENYKIDVDRTEENEIYANWAD